MALVENPLAGAGLFELRSLTTPSNPRAHPPGRQASALSLPARGPAVSVVVVKKCSCPLQNRNLAPEKVGQDGRKLGGKMRFERSPPSPSYHRNIRDECERARSGGPGACGGAGPGARDAQEGPARSRREWVLETAAWFKMLRAIEDV